MDYSEKALAKLTLTLRVLEKREDSYNNIDALTSYCKDLYDELYARSEKDLSLSVGNKSSVEKDLVTDESNLILKAYRIFTDALNLLEKEMLSFHFEVEKHIPSSAGLGGGSADCAATLRLLNNAYQNCFDDKDLVAMASELGSDIVGCLKSKILRMTQTGNSIVEINDDVTFLKNYKAIIITPDIICSTPQIYKHYDVVGRATHEGVEAPKDFASLTDNFHNDLEIAAFDLIPELREFKKHIESLVGNTFLLAGSGSSIFCILDNDQAQNQYLYLKNALQNELIHEKIRQLAISAIC